MMLMATAPGMPMATQLAVKVNTALKGLDVDYNQVWQNRNPAPHCPHPSLPSRRTKFPLILCRTLNVVTPHPHPNPTQDPRKIHVQVVLYMAPTFEVWSPNNETIT